MSRIGSLSNAIVSVMSSGAESHSTRRTGAATSFGSVGSAIYAIQNASCMLSAATCIGYPLCGNLYPIRDGNAHMSVHWCPTV
jgi:hypothetical protein